LKGTAKVPNSFLEALPEPASPNPKKSSKFDWPNLSSWIFADEGIAEYPLAGPFRLSGHHFRQRNGTGGRTRGVKIMHGLEKEIGSLPLFQAFD
jgi:hypothetical protein